MVFALTSFTDESSLRRFTFELAGSGPPRTSVVVVADMALVENMRFRSRNCPALRSPTPKLDSGRRRYGSALEKEMIEYANRRKEAKDLAERKRHMFRAAKTGAGGDA